MTELWSPPPRSETAANLYELAEADRAAHPERYRLDLDRLASGVIERAGRAPDSEEWRDGLGRYLASAQQDGRLNAVGVKMAAATAKGRLAARIRMDELLAERPEIASRVIDRPIVILGGWRTGTTLLQRMLAAIPALRATYPAELSAPWSAPHPGEADRWERFIDQRDAQAALDALNPALAEVHPFGNREAEECVLAMGTDGLNWGFPSTIRLDSYADWLASQDFTGSYERYADVLRVLQGDVSTRWVLKAPAHTAELAALLRAFPDACVVHLHRDVVATITSGCSLFAVFRSTYSDAVDPVQLGEYQLDTTATWFERSMEARDELPPQHPSTIVDLDFRELVSAPAATVKRLAERFEVALAPDVDERLAARLEHLDRQHGAHRYAPEQFGLDADQITERLSDYRTRFGLA